jgi:hypothetical protein
MFWQLTEYVLADHATAFDRSQLQFTLHTSPLHGVEPGLYHFITKKKGSINEPGRLLYRLSHPLGMYVLEQARDLHVPVCALTFHSRRKPPVAVVQQLRGKSGWLSLHQLDIEAFEHEQHLLFSGCTDEGASLHPEIAEKLFKHLAVCGACPPPGAALATRLEQEAEQGRAATLSARLEENSQQLSEKREQLERWAEDRIEGLELELRELRRQIAAAQRQTRQARTLDEQILVQQEVSRLEKLRRQKRTEMHSSEDEITARRDRLIEQMERRLRQRSDYRQLFTIRWSVA